MNTNVKYLIESFDIDDYKDDSGLMISQVAINDMLYKHHPESYDELKEIVD